MPKYIVNKYSGRTYCGNANLDTFDACIEFADDGFCNRAVICDTETGKKYTVKFEAEVDHV